jgi:centromere protein X
MNMFNVFTFADLFAEAIQRAGKVAQQEGSSTIEPVHLEKILPQLLLDF